MSACHSHLSIPWGSVMSTALLFPSAWDSNVTNCPDWRVSEWTLWGLESSVAGRTKAWPDIQAQNARAKVKKSDGLTDRQTDTVVYMSSRGATCVLSGHGHHLLDAGSRAWEAPGSSAAAGPRSSTWVRPPPVSGDGPEKTWKRPLCTHSQSSPKRKKKASLSHKDGPSSCPAPHSPSGSPGPLLARPLGSGSQGLNAPKGSATGQALSEAGGQG